MLQEISVPDIGSFSKVPVIEILVQVGDIVEVDQSLLTLETDKATMEIPAPVAGKITKLLIKLGDKISQGDKVMQLEALEANSKATADAKPNISEAAASAELTAAAEQIPSPKDSPNPESSQAYASPSVRRLSRVLEIDLASLNGTGPKGRISRDDLESYIKSSMQSPSSHSSNHPPLAAIDFSQFGDIDRQDLSRIKKISGAFLQRNWVMAPHVTQFEQVDITELEAFRQGQKLNFAAHDVKLTMMVFLIKALATALKKFPNFNASLDSSGNQLILKKYFNIGVAVDTPAGLVVPVIRQVEQKTCLELAMELKTLSTKARAGKLSGQDMQGGCMSISSLGGIGGTAFTPIINLPEVAILGVSKATIQAIFENQAFVPRLILPLSLSYDHRVIDGAEAARFITYLGSLLNDIRNILI